MVLTREESRQILTLLMDMGEAMLLSGAEIHRVEDTLSRAGTAYGALRTEVFAINSTIIASMEFEGAGELTHTRRIQGEETDLTRLEALNRLSRRIAREPLPPSVLKEALAEALEKRPAWWKGAVGSVLAAGGFALFFGGSPWDGLASAGFALLIWALQRWFSPLCPNRVFFNFVSSLITGLCICFFCRAVPALRADKVIIGDIMLLIPGIALTTSIRNMLVGDTMSGTMKLVEALLVAVALACGFMLAMALAGGGVI